ncbi:MAG: M56 family metallopeptidase [Aestuariibaculum sp.]
MLQYIFQTILFQALFLLLYDVLLKKETFFNWNRSYLLLTMALSLVLPLIQIAQFGTVLPENYIITLPEVVIGEMGDAETIVNGVVKTDQDGYMPLLCWGAIFAFLLFAYKLTGIIALIVKNYKEKQNKVNLVTLKKTTTAFSFFNYVFIGEQLSETEKTNILKHEMVHVNQRHTFDLLFFEVLRIVFWFNPLVYMYQGRIKTVHEYIADAETVKKEGKSQYYQNLLSQIFNTQKISFINPFFKQSLIKKRLVMLQKSKSKQIKLIKYVLLIPIILGMLVYSSCQSSLDEENTKNTEKISKNEMVLNVEDIGDFIKNELDNLIKEGKYSKLIVTDGKSKIEINVENNKVASIDVDKSKKTEKVEVASPQETGVQGVEVPFAVIEEVPVFPGCESLATNQERKDCMSKKVSGFVGKNFNTKLANNLGLKGRQRISVMFKIGDNGDITTVMARASHPGLASEAERVVKMLPKMQPGKQKGKTVTVPYSLPIVFQVADE